MYVGYEGADRYEFRYLDSADVHHVPVIVGERDPQLGANRERGRQLPLRGEIEAISKFS
jgi:hypothetical protein